MSFTSELDRIEKIRDRVGEFGRLMARQSMILVELESLGCKAGVHLKDNGDGTSEMSLQHEIVAAPEQH